MSTTSYQNGYFEPLHEAHAIDRVVIAVHVESALEQTQFAALKNRIRVGLQEQLPGVADLQSLTIAVDASGVAAPLLAPPGAVAMQLQRFSPSGTVEDELRVEPAGLVFQTTLYTRWTDTWERARGYFALAISEYLRSSRIRALSINYLDKFVWHGAASECRPFLLLRPQSPYICPHAYSANDLWHSHTGVFIRADDIAKRLLNVNVDFVDERGVDGTRKVVSIGTLLTDYFNQPEYRPVAAMDDVWSFIDSRMEHLHNSAKNLLAEVIQDRMCDRIELIG